MTIPLSDYIKVKDNYCIAYLGDDQHTLDKLILNRDKLQKMYPGVQIYLCVKDELVNFNYLHHPIVPLSKLNKKAFAFIREISDVEEFLQESELSA